MNIDIPKEYQQPLPIEAYTGEGDLEKHLDAFGNEMMFSGALEGVICRTFTRTLKGEGVVWELLQELSVAPSVDMSLSTKRSNEAPTPSCMSSNKRTKASGYSCLGFTRRPP